MQEEVGHCGDKFWGLVYAQAMPRAPCPSATYSSRCRTQLLLQTHVHLHTAMLLTMTTKDKPLKL